MLHTLDHIMPYIATTSAKTIKIYGSVSFYFTVKPKDTNICHMVKKHVIGLLLRGSIII